MKYYAGLDVSLAETAICVLDEDGIIVREGTAISDPNDIADWLQQLGIALARVGLEAARLQPGFTTGSRNGAYPPSALIRVG